MRCAGCENPSWRLQLHQSLSQLIVAVVPRGQLVKRVNDRTVGNHRGPHQLSSECLKVKEKRKLLVMVCEFPTRGHDASQITLALGTAASYPRACQALGAMLSRGALNPADITVLFKMFTSMDPPPVELVSCLCFVRPGAPRQVSGWLGEASRSPHSLQAMPAGPCGNSFHH